MFGPSRITSFLSFLALLGSAVAANLYRMDDRTPEQIHAAGGFVSWNPQGTGSVLDHVRKKLGNQDPWVSTTNDKKVAQGGARSPGSVYVYYINPSGLEIVDTAKAFKKANEDHPYPSEKEFSVRGQVPWNNIVSWETWTRSKKASTTTREEFEHSQSGGSSPKSATGASSPKSNTGASSPKKDRSVRSFVA